MDKQNQNQNQDNQSSTNPSDTNTKNDDAKKYQDILDQYSDVVSKEEKPSSPADENNSTPQTEPIENNLQDVTETPPDHSLLEPPKAKESAAPLDTPKMPKISEEDLPSVPESESGEVSSKPESDSSLKTDNNPDISPTDVLPPMPESNSEPEITPIKTDTPDTVPPLEPENTAEKSTEAVDAKMPTPKEPEPESPPIHPSLSDNLGDEDDQLKKKSDLSLPTNQPIQDNPPTLDEPNQNKTSIFKTTFIIALIVFFGVAAILAFSLFNPNQNNKQGSSKNSPTVIPEKENEGEGEALFCQIDDKKYQVGESFASEDGCNTCVCEDENVVNCTQNSCFATQSATSKVTTTPTPTSTSSAKTTSPTPTSTSSAQKTIPTPT